MNMPESGAARVKMTPLAVVVWLGAALVTFFVMIALDMAGVDSLGRPWAFITYWIAGHSILIPAYVFARHLCHRDRSTHS